MMRLISYVLVVMAGALFVTSGIANADIIYTAIWNGSLNQEWTYGACSGSNFAVNNGFYCGSNGSNGQTPAVPVVQNNWSVIPIYSPNGPYPPNNNDASPNGAFFNVTIGNNAGVVTIGDPAYSSCPTNNCIASSLVQVNSLILNSGSGVKLEGATNATMFFQQLDGGSGGLTNMGEVTLQGNSLLNFQGPQTNNISGGGLITLNSGTLEGSVGLTSDNTIHGTGLLSVGGVLTNTGTINADSSAGALTLQYGSIVNQGDILSTSTGGLAFTSAGPIDNTAGVIQASNGSSISVFATTITGGTIGLQNSGALTLTGATITGGVLDLGPSSIVTINGQSATSVIEGTVNALGGSQIQIGSTSNLALTSNGSYAANGSIQVANQAELLIGGTTTLTGSGNITLGGPSAFIAPYTNNSTLATSSGFIITGTGTMEVNFQNNGTIVADSGNNLTVNTQGGGTNTGTIIDRNGGVLTLSSPDQKALSNSSGLITAAAGGTLNLNQAVVDGGTISTTGNGAIALNNATLTNLALNNGVQGTMNISNFSTVTFGAGLQLTNNGILTLSNSSALIVNSAMTFQNAGTINLTGLGGQFQNIMYMEGDLTLAGAGSLNVDGGSIIVGSDHNLNNNGNTVTIGPVGQVCCGRTGGLVEQVIDYVQTAGTTIVSGTLQAQELDLEGGSLEGVGGTIEANVVNSGGTINPGDPGPMNIQGDFTQTTGGMTVLDIASASIFDTLSISGAANLGGALELNFEGGFVPVDGEIFNLLSWGGAETGAFSSISLEGLSGFTDTAILSSNGFAVELNGSAAPEPSTWMLVLGVGIGAGLLRFRRRSV